MIEDDYVKISFLKIHALKSYRPKHPPERYFFGTRYIINAIDLFTFDICKLLRLTFCKI